MCPYLAKGARRSVGGTFPWLKAASGVDCDLACATMTDHRTGSLGTPEDGVYLVDRPKQRVVRVRAGGEKWIVQCCVIKGVRNQRRSHVGQELPERRVGSERASTSKVKNESGIVLPDGERVVEHAIDPILHRIEEWVVEVPAELRNGMRGRLRHWRPWVDSGHGDPVEVFRLGYRDPLRLYPDERLIEDETGMVLHERHIAQGQDIQGICRKRWVNELHKFLGAGIRQVR